MIHYDFKFIKAKILIIQSTIALKLGGRYQDVVHSLDQAETIFLDLGFKDGTADAMFLKAIALINSIDAKFKQMGNNTSFTGFKSFERSNSEDLAPYNSKIPKLTPKSSFHNSNSTNQFINPKTS